MTMIIEPKTREVVASEYHITSRTFLRWIKREGLKLSPGLLTPKEILLIYEAFEYPQLEVNVR